MLFKYKHFLLLSLFCGFNVAIHAAAVDESKQQSSFLTNLDAFKDVYKKRVIAAIKLDYKAELTTLKKRCENRYSSMPIDALFGICQKQSLAVEGKKFFEFEDTCRERLVAALREKMESEIATRYVLFQRKADQVLLKYDSELQSSAVQYLAFLGLKNILSSTQERMQEAVGRHFFGSSSVYALTEPYFIDGVISILAINKGLEGALAEAFHAGLMQHNTDFDRYKRSFENSFSGY